MLNLRLAKNSTYTVIHYCEIFSTGFCASRSRAIFMDITTKAIIHMEVGDAREKWAGTVLEWRYLCWKGD
jgi:hypothetical protein